MKNLRLFTLSLLLPARAAFAQVDVTSTVTEALANTLDGDNYRWTSQLTLPLGEQLSVTGESAGNLKRITTVGPRGTETVFVVGRQAFRQAEAGWEVLPTRNREDRVRALQDQPPAGDPTQPKRGTPDRLIMRGGFPPHTGIEFALRGAVEQVESWSLQGEAFIGSFDGAIRGGRGARGGRDADVTTTISLRVESGLVTQAVLSTTGTITTPDGTSRDINRREATTFTDIGTVVLVTPTEVQALLESNVARATR